MYRGNVKQFVAAAAKQVSLNRALIDWMTHEEVCFCKSCLFMACEAEGLEPVSVASNLRKAA